MSENHPAWHTLEEPQLRPGPDTAASELVWRRQISTINMYGFNLLNVMLASGFFFFNKMYFNNMLSLMGNFKVKIKPLFYLTVVTVNDTWLKSIIPQLSEWVVFQLLTQILPKIKTNQIHPQDLKIYYTPNSWTGGSFFFFFLFCKLDQLGLNSFSQIHT